MDSGLIIHDESYPNLYARRCKHCDRYRDVRTDRNDRWSPEASI